LIQSDQDVQQSHRDIIKTFILVNHSNVRHRSCLTMGEILKGPKDPLYSPVIFPQSKFGAWHLYFKTPGYYGVFQIRLFFRKQ
jgi:hypothetical protein